MSETLTHPDEGAAFISEQDAALRRWTHDTPWPIKIGSDEHRKMFCQMLLDTHDPYRPAVLDWPQLEPDALEPRGTIELCREENDARLSRPALVPTLARFAPRLLKK